MYVCMFIVGMTIKWKKKHTKKRRKEEEEENGGIDK